MIRVADYIARFLVRQGVRDIFVLTGNGAMYLNDAFTLQPELKYYCARNEAAAPMMAEAYARIKGSLGAVCLTSGPGSTNAIPGLAEAWVDSAPIMILSGQVQRNHTSLNAGVEGLRSFGTAEINIVPIVNSITKYAVMINEPESIRYHLEKAAYLALHGRPGPVWIDVPMDVQYAMIDETNLKPFVLPESKSSSESIDSQVNDLVELILNSRRPLIVAGQGVRQSGSVHELKAFIEELNAPVMFSRLGQDILPFSHPNNLGHGGLKGTKYCRLAMKRADAIIALGSRLTVQFAGIAFDAFDPTAKIAMVDIDAAELKKPGVKLDVPIQADLKQVIDLLRKKIADRKKPDWSEWLGECRRLKESYPMVLPQQKRNPIDLYYFMSRLDAFSGEKHIFTTDAGSNYYVGGQVYRFEKGQREVTSGTFAAMGLSIPLAIGAAIADKNAQILAVTGDGSLELNIQELKTMSYYKLDLKLFVINNGGYLSMRNWQDGFFEGRRIGSDDKTGAEGLNLKKIAEAFDLPYACISRHEEIDQRIKKICAHKGPVFVEVICDSQQKIIKPLEDPSLIEAVHGN